MPNITTLIISVIIALISALFGYKLHKLVITLCWFIVGFIIAGTITANFTETMPIILSVSAVVGILTGFLGLKIEKAGVFILCFVSVFLFSYTYFDQEILKWGIGVLGGIIGGIIGIKFFKPTIIFFTSFQGAFLIVNTLLPYFKIENQIITLVSGAIVTIFAIYFQFKTNKHVS